jgi:hypothetical protein
MEATSEIYTRSKNGLKLLCKATRGGQQGEPFTNFAYALLIDPTLKKCSELYPEVMNKLVQDDEAVAGEMEITQLAKSFLVDEYEQLGLTINESKEKRYIINKGADEDGQQNEPKVMKDGVNHYGITICSIPIGSKEYVTQKLPDKINETMDQIVDITERFNKYDSQVAFTAIKLSFQNKLDYLISNLPVHLTKPWLQHIDDIILKCFEKAIGASFDSDSDSTVDPEFIKDRMRIKSSMGGVGM